MAHAAFEVADAVQRMHDVFGQLRAFAEDRFQHVRRGVGKSREVGVSFVAEHFVEHEERVAHGRRISRHVFLQDGLCGGPDGRLQAIPAASGTSL